MKNILSKVLSKPMLIFGILLFLLILFKLPSLFEPTWYGDEGIYAAVGNDISHGELLYKETWDNKTPGIYYIYSLAFNIFGVNQFAVRFIALIVIIIAFWFFFKSFRLLFDKTSFLLPGLVFVFFWTTPAFESNIANGENFFILCSMIGLYYGLKLIHGSKKLINSIILGLIFGIGFMIKIHPLFEYIALLLIIYLVHAKPTKISDIFALKNIFNKQIIISIICFVLPLLGYLGLAALQGNISDFIKMFFSQGGTYVFEYQNQALGFIIFENTLQNRTIALAIVILVLVYLYTKKLVSEKIFIVCTYFFFVLYAVLFSGRPYAHYLLQLVVPAILLATLALLAFKNTALINKFKLLGVAFLVTFFVFGMFFNGQHISGYSIVPYYNNFVSYITGNKTRLEYIAYFDPNMPKLDKLVEESKFLKGKDVILLDNTPWFYPLVDVRNQSKYVALYHLGQDRVNFKQWAEELPQKAEYVIKNNERLDIIPSEIEAVVDAKYEYVRDLGVFSLYRRK